MALGVKWLQLEHVCMWKHTAKGETTITEQYYCYSCVSRLDKSMYIYIEREREHKHFSSAIKHKM